MVMLSSRRACRALGVVLAGIWAGASLAADAPRYPLKASRDGRYLVDQRGKPFLLAGDSPQALIVNLTEAEADRYFADRQAHGFNAVWINLLCATYTAGRADASTIDGLRPFTTPDDLTTPNEAYFAHCDRVLALAARHHLVVFLDPAETGSFLAIMKKNGPAKCRAYGRFLGKRYARFDNLVWMHGNDYGQHTPENDAVVTAVALGIRDYDRRHLHTVELNPEPTISNSLDDPRWASIVGLNAAYTYAPPYLALDADYQRTPRMPAFLVETGYEFENLTGHNPGDARRLRAQEYMTDLSGATGQLYGNHYTWTFAAGWPQKLDTPGAAQIVYVQALFEPRLWYKLVPDRDHRVVTAGYGTYGGFDSVTAARIPDGRLVIAYIPDRRTITVDMTRLRGPALARWYDPAAGTFRPIGPGRLPNRGSREFATPGDNADGPGNTDWVLVLETNPPPAPHADHRP